MTLQLNAIYTTMVRGKTIREIYRAVTSSSAAVLFAQTSQVSNIEQYGDLYALLSGIATGFAVVCVHHAFRTTRRKDVAHTSQRSTQTF